MSSKVLETSGLCKRFGDFTAVNNVDLSVERGDIHALVGPNGAGKTTLFNLITRFVSPTEGEILFEGAPISRVAPAEIARRGIIRSFQISSVFNSLTVLDNVRVVLLRKFGWSFSFMKSRSALDEMNDEAMEALDSVRLGDFSSEIAGNLPYGRKRALELAVTLAMDPVLMLLDEPTQGMGYEDVQHIAGLIKEVSAGRSVLMVEHNMTMVAQIADRLTVLQRGEIIADGCYGDVSKNPEVISAYLGGGGIAGEQAHALQ